MMLCTSTAGAVPTNQLVVVVLANAGEQMIAWVGKAAEWQKWVLVCFWPQMIDLLILLHVIINAPAKSVCSENPGCCLHILLPVHGPSPKTP
jgi:hypothetical protein